MTVLWIGAKSVGKPGLVILCKAISLRKHAYSYILRILPPKNEDFLIKNI